MEEIFEFDLFSIVISALYFGLIICLLILLLSYGNKVKKSENCVRALSGKSGSKKLKIYEEKRDLLKSHATTLSE